MLINKEANKINNRDPLRLSVVNLLLTWLLSNSPKLLNEEITVI